METEKVESLIVPAFAMLLIEEFQKLLSGPSVSNIDVSLGGSDSSILVACNEAVNHDGFEYAPSGVEYQLNLDACMPSIFSTTQHYFRVDVCCELSYKYNQRGQGWREMYYGKPVLIGSLFFSKNLKAITKWRAGEDYRTDLLKVSGTTFQQCDPDVFKVCNQIIYPLDDPQCQVNLAKKIHAAMGNYMLTKQLLPDH